MLGQYPVGKGSPRRVNGFTLIEVLVTIIVLAIGILGLAGLQIAGMRSNHSAYLRTQAVLAASDLSDRMRLNPAEFIGQQFYSGGGSTTFDRWAAELARTLPAPTFAAADDDSGGAGDGSGEGGDASGSAQAVADCSDGNACGTSNCQILIRWDDSRVEDEDLAQAGSRDPQVTEFSVCTRLPEG